MRASIENAPKATRYFLAINNFLKRLGPGLLFAAAAIGVSHLVQSTQAGADYGFGLLWALILCNFFKYPFFLFGTKYTHVTGETLLDGYKRIGRYVLILHFIISIVTIFTVQAAVTIVTAGLAVKLFGMTADLTTWSGIITAGCLLLLLVGKYRLLDNLIKMIILVLSVSTISALIFACLHSHTAIPIKQVIPSSLDGIIFLAAFMGWMPAPLDTSIWQSIWVKEKISSDNSINYKTARLDFNIGYITTVILGICFIGLGAIIMHHTNESFSGNATEFASQLIQLYTSTLGSKMFVLIAMAAFITMFSTTLTCMDASPRATGKTLSLLGCKNLGSQNLWLLFLSIGTLIIFMLFKSEMGALIKVATTLSFITSPIYATLNYLLITSKHIPEKDRLHVGMKIYAISGIIFLSFFSIWYLTLMY